jgi:hypothetical protein
MAIPLAIRRTPADRPTVQKFFWKKIFWKNGIRKCVDKAENPRRVPVLSKACRRPTPLYRRCRRGSASDLLVPTFRSKGGRAFHDCVSETTLGGGEGASGPLVAALSGAISIRLPAAAICGPLRGRAERLALSLLHLPETFPRRKWSSTGLQSSRDRCPAAFVPSNRDGLLRYQSSEVRGTDAHRKSTSQR